MRNLTLLAFAVCLTACGSGPSEATDWNALFDNDTEYGWAGGDAAYSVPLPESRTLWLFGDSYLGATQGSQRVYVESRFGNTIAIQDDPEEGEPPTATENALYFDWGAPTSGGWLPLFESTLADPNRPPSLDGTGIVVSWPLHGIVIDGDLVLFNAIITSVPCEDCGKFAFKVHGSTVSIVRGVDRPYEEWGFVTGEGWPEAQRPEQRFVSAGSTTPDPLDPSGLLWGTFVHRAPDDPDTVYVYGHRRTDTASELVVARIRDLESADDLFAVERWEFYNGSFWTIDPTAVAAVMSDSAVEVSMVAAPNSDEARLVAVHSGVDMFSGRIHVATAENPWGPFTERYVLALADCPVGNFDPTSPPVAYAAKAHPHFTTEDELLVSVVLSPFTEENGRFVQADYYVPRFLRLPWDEVFENETSSPERCVR